MDRKGLHDLLLEQKPEGASHDSVSCEWCVAESAEDTHPQEAGGGSTVKTYTEEEFASEVAKAVADATAGLHAELASFKDKATSEEVEARIAAAKAEAEEQLAEVRKQLDEKVLEAQSERDKRAELETWLEAEKAKAEAEAEIASRRDDRITKIREVASFPEEYVTANTDRWAGMDDEAFVAYLEDIKAVAIKNPVTDGVPAGTAMTASREGGTTTGIGSAIREVLDLRGRGIDTRTL
jgi:hypothetical protein